jgi:hypothetical protein
MSSVAIDNLVTVLLRVPVLGVGRADGPTSREGPAPRRGAMAQDGSIGAFVVLLLLALFALIGLVVDGGSAITAQQSAYNEAEQAARAGAGAVSVDALRSGLVRIDQSGAVAAAEAFTVAAGHPGIATVSGGTVHVQVHYRIPTEILGIVGISSLPVSASASAIDVHGVTAATP